jgi:hypothetical protein
MCKHTYIHTHRHTCTGDTVAIRIKSHIHTYIHIHTHKQTYVICTHTHTYIHTYTRTGDTVAIRITSQQSHGAQDQPLGQVVCIMERAKKAKVVWGLMASLSPKPRWMHPEHVLFIPQDLDDHIPMFVPESQLPEDWVKRTGSDKYKEIFVVEVRHKPYVCVYCTLNPIPLSYGLSLFTGQTKKQVTRNTYIYTYTYRHTHLSA